MDRTKLRSFVILPIILILALTGCAGISNPEGWSGAAVLGDRVFVGTMNGDIRALDKATGETEWTFAIVEDSDKTHVVYGSPIISGDAIYFAAYNGRLYSLSTATGNTNWEATVGTGDYIVGGVAVDSDTVYVGSNDSYMYAFDITDGSQKWRFKTERGIWATPVVADGRLYFGSLDHNFYALNTSDGTEIWKAAADGAVTAKPVVQDGRVYIGSFASEFLALDASSGSEVWRFAGAESWYWGEAVATADMIFAPSLDGKLYALNISNGQLRWKLETGGAIIGRPAIVRDRIAVGSRDGRLRIVKLVDGQGTTQCNLGAEIRTPITADGAFLYLGTADHGIRAIEVKTNGNPDDVWAHFSNEDVPVSPDRQKPC